MSAPWRYKVDSHSPPLEIYERADRGNQLYVKWSVGKSHKRPKLNGIKTVRGPDGRVRDKLVKKAIAEAITLYDLVSSSPDHAVAGSPVDGGDITIPEGFALVLDERTGKYATRTAQCKTMERTRGRILQILGDAFPFSQLRPTHYRTIWRAYAEHWLEWGLDWRMAETAVSCLFAAENWLYNQGHIAAARGPGRGWRTEFLEEWEQLTGIRPEPARPRHEESDVRALWTHLHLADVRLQLAYELGAEFRLGQVIRCDRRDLCLKAGVGDGHGTLLIRGRGKKRGQLVYLTVEQRAAVDRSMALSGYLADYEAAFARGELADYPLWPGGKLSDGRALLRSSPLRTNRRTLLKLFHKLEQIAGVAHVPGRAWYGVRRASTDLTADFSTDERVRDAAGGWSDGSDVRSRVYQGSDLHRVLSQAAEARRKARGVAPQQDPTASLVSHNIYNALLALPPEKVRALLALLT